MYCLFLFLLFIYWETMRKKKSYLIHPVHTTADFTEPYLIFSSVIYFSKTKACSLLTQKLYNNIHACLHASPTYILSEMRTLIAYQIREMSTALYSNIMFCGLFSLPFLIIHKSQFAFLTAARISWCFQRNIHNDFQSTFLSGNN